MTTTATTEDQACIAQTKFDFGMDSEHTAELFPLASAEWCNICGELHGLDASDVAEFLQGRKVVSTSDFFGWLGY